MLAYIYSEIVLGLYKKKPEQKTLEAPLAGRTAPRLEERAQRCFQVTSAGLGRAGEP